MVQVKSDRRLVFENSKKKQKENNTKKRYGIKDATGKLLYTTSLKMARVLL